METTAKTKTFEQTRADEQTHARLRLHLLLAFMNDNDSKHLTAWECDFLDSIEAERLRFKDFVISQRQQETLEKIYASLSDKGLV